MEQRVIKFRGKRIDNGEWVYGSLLQSEIDINQFAVECFICERFASESQLNKIPVIPETVGMFTGITDKNGKEIYQGDIVTAANGKSYTIQFGEWSFDAGDSNGGNNIIEGVGFSWDGEEPFSKCFGENKYEITGTIHDK